MRLRNIPGAKEHIFEDKRVINDPEALKNNWESAFGNKQPIYIEVGMGKGDFIIENALRYPEINFIGIERYSSVLYKALQKMDAYPECKNIVFLRYDAMTLEDVFGENEISAIYLNFSDPWPKKRYAKRRLTHMRFLNKYKVMLKDNGWLEFKTDNDDLFEFSLEELEESPFKLVAVSRDLHNSDLKPDNIMTEYERKFSEVGKSINYMRINHK